MTVSAKIVRDRLRLEIMMRALILASLATAAIAVPAMAQEPPPLFPKIAVGGGVSPGDRFEWCIDVEIGGSRAFNCLNEELRRHVDRVNPTLNLPPVSARSADVQVGVANMPAVRQQYGRNFGVSIVPFRPGPQAFTSPLTRP